MYVMCDILDISRDEYGRKRHPQLKIVKRASL